MCEVVSSDDEEPSTSKESPRLKEVARDLAERLMKLKPPGFQPLIVPLWLPRASCMAKAIYELQRIRSEGFKNKAHHMCLSLLAHPCLLRLESPFGAAGEDGEDRNSHGVTIDGFLVCAVEWAEIVHSSSRSWCFCGIRFRPSSECELYSVWFGPFMHCLRCRFYGHPFRLPDGVGYPGR